MNDVYKQYLDNTENMICAIKKEELDKIELIAQKFANCISNEGLVHMYGSGHSRMGVEEMYPRYASYPGYHPIVELSTSYYGNVFGGSGIRQGIFIENIEGLAERIITSNDVREKDCFLLFTTSGTGNVVIEMAMEAKKRDCFVVGVISEKHSNAGKSKHSSGKKLADVVDIVLDNKAPVGDASVFIDGLDAPVGAMSTIGNAILVNLIKVRVAELLTIKGQPPKVITHAHYVGPQKAQESLEESLCEYERRIRRK